MASSVDQQKLARFNQNGNGDGDVETRDVGQDVMGRRTYNELKRRALGAFEERGWLSPPVWAVLAGYYPVRAAYTYLKHLWTWKLLERRLDRRGLLLYRLSKRGQARLGWLRENAK